MFGFLLNGMDVEVIAGFWWFWVKLLTAALWNTGSNIDGQLFSLRAGHLDVLENDRAVAAWIFVLAGAFGCPQLSDVDAGIGSKNLLIVLDDLWPHVDQSIEVEGFPLSRSSISATADVFQYIGNPFHRQLLNIKHLRKVLSVFPWSMCGFDY